MIHNTTRNSAYNDSFVCEKTHSQLKDWGATKTTKTGDEVQFSQNVMKCVASGDQKAMLGKSDFLKLCNTMMELDFSDSIYNVSCPTLVIYGEKDRANKNASIELANMLIDAELQVFNGVGHEINIEAPDKLEETLRVFFGKV